jgi:WD40 repeat protein
LFSGTLIHDFREHTDTITALTISPDGQYLVTASRDQTLKIWHLPQRKLWQTLSIPQENITAIAISADSQAIATSSVEKTIKIWRIA